MNYHDHVRETGMPAPTEPVIFIKATSCIAGPNDDVKIPRNSVKTDYEVELGIVIGMTARYVSEEDALDHVAGYVLSNDVSEREHQIERGGSWDKGKGHDGFGPIGPWLVTQDELGEAGDIALVTRVNGEIRQDGSTADMIFGVKEIVAYTSNFFTLEPGDIIITGTPSGVGIGQKPDAKFLKNGDVVELDGGPLGTQRQRFVAHEQDAG
jgi:2-keto-4-pentenoate hydratase/2-oxohepta-3-ene-1,7-dioic acid hydratase in catechol pathway